MLKWMIHCTVWKLKYVSEMYMENKLYVYVCFSCAASVAAESLFRLNLVLQCAVLVIPSKP